MKDLKARPLYIFDLDGTLALNHQRNHYLQNKDDPQRWKRFFEACDKDLPNTPVIRTMEALRIGADVWIWSGRSDEVKDKTVKWLVDNTSFLTHDIETILKMRKAGDFTPDDEIKTSWLEELNSVDRKRLVAIFDDRDKVVKKWRSLGVCCFQVAEGDF